MASNGANETATLTDTDNSLEKIKRQLSTSARNLLQGPLLKRSETLRIWNERWVMLDPTTGKMEYKVRRNEPDIKGTIVFDANSIINLSPLNFHGQPKYNGCCIYIGTPQKNEYFLCAQTPDAARAWVSTLHATQLVLKAHKEAVNSLSGNGNARFGTVAAVVAAANLKAQEASKEIEAALQISLRNALRIITDEPRDGPMDDLTIMKETLRVKDEELQNLAKAIRARDATIKDIAGKLSETAEAAEAAASAAHTMDEQRKTTCAEIERLTGKSMEQLNLGTSKLRESEEKVASLNKEKDQLIKQRDSAIQEAHLWRSELAKAREHIATLEGAIVRAEEKVRTVEADADDRINEAVYKESAALKDKQELLAYVSVLEAQLQRQHTGSKQVTERTEASSDVPSSLPLTKHVDMSEKNVDKECPSDSKAVSEPGESIDHLTENQVNMLPTGYGEWGNNLAMDGRMADVREVAPETATSSLDISVVNPTVRDQRNQE